MNIFNILLFIVAGLFCYLMPILGIKKKDTLIIVVSIIGLISSLTSILIQCIQ